MALLYYPTKILQWGKNKPPVLESDPPQESYMTVRCSLLIEIYNNSTGVLLKKLWDKDGGVWPDNNHPTGAEIDIPLNTDIKVVVYNLSRNRMPVQVQVFHASTSNTNDFSTYPKGIVDGVGSITDMNIAVNLHKQILGGEKTEMIFRLTSVVDSWWKINTLAWFVTGTQFTSTNPNNGTDYFTDFFNLLYQNNNIVWNNPNTPTDISLPNTTNWSTESGVSANSWFNPNAGNTTCENVIDGLILADWNNAGDGIYSLKNQPLKVKEVQGKKILAKIINTTQYGDEYEVRGKNLYIQGGNIVLRQGIPSDGSLTSCLSGEEIGYGQDNSFVKDSYYWKDGTVYRPFQKPVIQTSLNIQKNTNIIGKVFQYGNVKVYKNGSQYSVSDLTVNSETLLYNFKPTESGDYQFVLYNSNGISDLSVVVKVAEELKYDYIAPCITDCDIEFGVSKLDKDLNVSYQPSMGLIRLNTSGDVVQTGGKLYQHRVFNLAPGEWYFYFREKNNNTNIKIVKKIFS